MESTEKAIGCERQIKCNHEKNYPNVEKLLIALLKINIESKQYAQNAPLQVRDRRGLNTVTGSRIDKTQERNDVLTDSDLTRGCARVDRWRRSGTAACDGSGSLGGFAAERQRQRCSAKKPASDTAQCGCQARLNVWHMRDGNARAKLTFEK